MKATADQATDGRRVVKVEFRRQSADADAPMIEVTYEVTFPDDFRITRANSPVLVFLTATRTDTRESVTLDTEEKAAAQAEAVNCAAAMSQSDD